MKSINWIKQPQVSAKLLSTSLVPLFFVSAALAAAPAPAAPKSPAAQTGQSAKPDAAQHSEDAVYATVNGRPILTRDYVNAFNATLRQKFYHGRVPEGAMSKVREEVLEQMIQDMLLVDEAKRRGLTVDESKVEETIAGYEKQYANSPAWQQNRERLLPGLRIRLAEQNLLEQIKKAVRTVAEVTDAEAKRFYDDHPDLFTEPEKLRLSNILLKVDPSSPKAVWDQTLEEAKAIHERLKNGADFAETARLHSNGNDAEQGGDLGYVHRGMLPDVLQAKIDDLKVGAITEPMTILEGVAIFRLDDRRPAQLRQFSEVTERARDLARREREEAAWSELTKRLRAAAKIKILVQPQPGTDAVRP